MRTALVGLSNNISNNIGKIKIWATSFKRFSDGDVVLLCGNSSPEEILMIENLNIIAVPVVIKDTWYINHERLAHTLSFIQHCRLYDNLIVTDVFDVIFQGDPFSKLEFDKYDVFVSGEGVKVNEEPWNADNISKIFPKDRAICGEIEVINSGIIAGKRSALESLFQRMYLLCESGSNAHNIKDQAALIVMIAKNEIERLKIFNLDDGWAMHCAVSGPTQFFVGWGFNNKIKYGIPHMVDGFVVDKFDRKYNMVHQFNRVPEWRTILEKSYHE